MTIVTNTILGNHQLRSFIFSFYNLQSLRRFSDTTMADYRRRRKNCDLIQNIFSFTKSFVIFFAIIFSNFYFLLRYFLLLAVFGHHTPGFFGFWNIAFSHYIIIYLCIIYIILTQTEHVSSMRSIITKFIVFPAKFIVFNLILFFNQDIEINISIISHPR